VSGVNWIGFVAARYISRGRKNSPSSVLAVLGIATGVLALVVILAVMNGFQLGFIESILEVSSYHLRLERFPPEAAEEIRENILTVPGVSSVSAFRDFQGLIRGRRGGQQGAFVRGITENAADHDSGLRAKLRFEQGNGSFDIEHPFSILLGAELAKRLSVRLGDEVTLFSISDVLSSGDNDGAAILPFTVTGIFMTGFYEYDLSWAFVNIDTAASLSGGRAALSLGIKLRNRWQDKRAEALIAHALSEAGFDVFEVSSWRDYNRAFFGALRTEKLFMFILVGLIFIVVGLNIFQAQRRSVLERREEIGLLRAVGASDKAVRLVFVWDGVIIGFTGAFSGLCLGLIIAAHISLFFTILEGIVNQVIHLLNLIMGYSGEAGEFAVFSPAVFYIKEIPSRLIFHEVLLIFMFGFLSALLAAWFASGRVSRARPAEVLRYE
jgi:lipoprotein-releasing system permease protein